MTKPSPRSAEAMELVRSGTSIFKAAAECQMDPKTLTKLCRAAGIKSTASKAPRKVDERKRVLQLWQQGLSTAEIAERVGVTDSSIYHWTKGVPRGTPQMVGDLARTSGAALFMVLR